MTHPLPPEQPHEAGGTYGAADVSPAAERSRFRATQHYPAPALPQADANPEHGGAPDRLGPGSQLDAGTS